MRSLIITLICLLVSQNPSFSQKISDVWFESHLNVRNSKSLEEPFDWWIGGKTGFSMDSMSDVVLEVSRERDAGEMYNAYSVNVESDHYTLNRTFDQERSINVYTASAHAPVGSWKLGVGYVISKKSVSENLHVSYSSKYLEFTSMFLKGPSKVSAELKPGFEISKGLSMYYDVSILLVSDKSWDEISLKSPDAFYESVEGGLKYNSGVTVKYVF